MQSGVLCVYDIFLNLIAEWLEQYMLSTFYYACWITLCWHSV